MSTAPAPLPIACAHCGAPIEDRPKEGLSCSACPRRYRVTEGMLDLRLRPAEEPEPTPCARGELTRALAEMRAGKPFRPELERVLLEIPEDRSNQLDLALRECRGAWLPLLRASAAAQTSGSRALFAGNPLSGTVVGLAKLGYDVVAIDRSPERLAFAQFRNEWLVPGRVTPVLAGDGERLPFAGQSFDCAVQEEGLPGRGTDWTYAPAELRRVCRGELALVADNRFGYKRSSGAKSEFEIPGPLEYARDALWPATPLRSIGGYRRALRDRDFAPARAFALYPHRRDFAYVAAIDERSPRLWIGEKERANRVKMLAHRAGLFPLLTPSFLFTAVRQERARDPSRLDRVLDALAELLREPRPEPEQLVATRGNTSLVLTGVPGRGEDDPRGRWALHLSVSPLQQIQAVTHFRRLQDLRARHAGFPVPEPLHMGEVAGIFLVCSRRLGGLTAPQHAGDLAIARRMYAESAEHLVKLVLGAPIAMDEALLAELVDAKFDLVARYAAVPSTLAWLAEARGRAREQLAGERFPRVVYHADLRSKHVQVAPDGRVLGYLDFGSSEASDLPYFDLLHLIVHERKNVEGTTIGDAWRAMLRGELREFERAPLEDYRARLGLSERYCRAIEQIYPVLVTAMAEKNWEYSRPRWMHRAFGI